MSFIKHLIYLQIQKTKYIRDGNKKNRRINSW